MKIGILGGSFNPPHYMHKKAALTLIEHHYLDRVIFVPTGDFYQKNQLIDAKDRYYMLQLMVEDHEKLDVSDFEIKSHLMYTYQTLDYFKTKYPDDEIYFICGSDNFKDLKHWQNYQYILKHYHLLVFQRDEDNLKEILNTYENKEHIILLPISLGNLSSTIIRKKIKQDISDDTLIKMLDRKVINYIRNKKLYGG